MALMMSHFSPFPIDTPALRVQGVGVQEVMQPCFFDRPKGWPQFLFVVFYDEAWCHTGSSQFRVSPGTFICWRPRTPQGLGNAQQPWNHSWLSVSGREVARTLRETHFPINRPLPLRDLSFFDPALVELHNEITRLSKITDPIDLQIARSYVVNIIRRLARGLRPSAIRSRVPQEILTLRQQIDSHFHEQLGLTGLAEKAGLSVSQLCFLHKKHFGTSVMAYLRTVRFQQAARLLRDSQLKVHAIAQIVGYPNHFHFSKAFKHQFGKSPALFRRSIQ